MKQFLPLLLFIVITQLYSCTNSSNKNIEKITDRKSTEIDAEDEEDSIPKANWRNPFMSPMGADISRIIRGYYLVGDYKKMLQFVILPDCYLEDEIIYCLRKSTWGYEIRANNLQWQSDSSFILNVKTNIQNTQGSEQYLGKIVNDTAKLYLFPEKETLFPYFGKEKISESCDLKNLMKAVQFGFNDAKLLPQSKKSLDKLKDFLTKNPTLNAHFIGHTSDEGSDEYNQKLSEARAKSVVDYLVSKGIKKSRLSSEGKGATEPISTENRERNRRVEIRLSRN
ncbi:MAG: OmpA family protein [Bacteroidetes bacterium]|nr:OmpA family protein [Bacteroidota bacterium]